MYNTRFAGVQDSHHSSFDMATVPVLPPDLGILPEPEGLDYVAYAQQLVEQRRQCRKIADQTLAAAREKSKAAREKKGKRIPDLAIGTQVLLWVGHTAGPMEPRWSGPYTVVGVPNAWTRELDGLPTGEYPVVHVQRLREYKRRDAPRPATPEIDEDQDTKEQRAVDEMVHEEEVEAGDVYEVEAIEGERLAADGKRQFNVKWKNYGAKYNTWEPEENLTGCEETLAEWRARNAEVQTADATSKKRSVTSRQEESGEEGHQRGKKRRIALIRRSAGEIDGRMCSPRVESPHKSDSSQKSNPDDEQSLRVNTTEQVVTGITEGRKAPPDRLQEQESLARRAGRAGEFATAHTDGYTVPPQVGHAGTGEPGGQWANDSALRKARRKLQQIIMGMRARLRRDKPT